MKSMNRFIVGVVFLFFVIMVSPSFAEGPFYTTSTASKVSHKLWRGTLNVLFCIVEIPLSISEEWQNMDPFTGVWLGTYKGTCKAVARASVGAFEVLTFPFPVPDGYKSPIEPEFPLLKKSENYVVNECKVEEVR